MALLKKREVILAKVESTYGTDATPTAGDNAIQVENVSWSHEGARMIDRPLTKPSIGMRQSIYGGSLMSITFDVELKGSGAAGTAPDCGALFLGCGMDETISASTSVTYAPVSTAQDSLTIWYYQDGLLHKMTGARGSFTIQAAAGERVMASFTFTGKIGSVSDAALASPTYDSTGPLIMKGASFSVLSYSATIGVLSIDMGNSISQQPDVNDADGFGEILITGRSITGSIDPLATLEATEAWVANYRAGTAGSLTTGTIGSTAGNRLAITCGQTYYREIGPGDRDGALIYDIGFGAAETATGDDEISVVFT